MKSLAIVALLAATASLSVPAAAAVIVASQSFEAPALNSPGIQYGPDQFAFNSNAVGPVVIAGFSFSNFSGIIKNGSAGVFANATDGTQAAFIQSFRDTAPTISWSLSGLSIGQAYTLSFDSAGSFIVPTNTFTVTILGGAPSALYNPTTTYSNNVINFTATSTSGTIDFNGSLIAGNSATAIDNLVLSAVPEPATWAMLVVGFGMVGFAARRRTAAVAA